MTDSVRFPYKTFARKESHPARLGALARLSGIDAASVDSCSVLELGCGDGRNIIPIAVAYPTSRFVGVDIASELIEKGRREVAELGLSNIELITTDLAQYNPPSNEFDYVICHGVYSWVPEELQKRILALTKRALAPQGVAFVSYNTLPGWRQRGVVRDILQVGSLMSEQNDEASRYDAGMRLLERLAREPQLSSYVREAAQRLTQSEPSYIVQEFLGECNSPALFIDFMRSAQDTGLQFVAEARVVMMSSEDLSGETKSLLESFGDDVWMREQVLDIVRNRTFRETLLCHESIAVNRGLSTRVFKELVFVANLLPVDSDAQDSTQGVLFRERTTEREISAPRGECEQVLRVLAGIGVRGATVSALLERMTSEGQMSEHDTIRALVTLWKTGFVDAVTAPLCGQGAEATVSPLAQLQIIAGERVTSFLHESLTLSELERQVLQLAAKSPSFQALETLALQYAPAKEAHQAIWGLREKGFFR